MSLPGRHNVLNALAALGAALAAGVSPAAAADALRRFPRPPRRLELHRFGPDTVLNDVAMNEASYETVFSTIADAGLGTPVVVHALRGRRGAALNARLAVVLARWARRLSFAPLIASLSEDVLARYPLPYQVREEEYAAFLQAAAEEGLAVHLHRTLADAVAEGVARLTPQQVLVLLGTFGMDDGPRLAGRLLAQRAGLGAIEEPRYPGQEDDVGF
jgi:UDP-N-acetylmuramyl pentapeptide synthase